MKKLHKTNLLIRIYTDWKVYHIKFETGNGGYMHVGVRGAPAKVQVVYTDSWFQSIILLQRFGFAKFGGIVLEEN